MDLKDKKVLITGGSDGLGLEIAKKFFAEGSYVSICGLDDDKLRKVEKSFANEKFKAYICDISDYSQVENFVKTVGNIDILVNNAGIFTEGLLETNSPEIISKLIDVNLKGTIFVTRAALPYIDKNKESFIINISSTVGTEPRPNSSTYVASKYGVTGFTDSLKLDLEKTKVKVIGIYPGSMKTEFHIKAGFSRDRENWMTAEEVANVVLFTVNQPSNAYIDKIVVRNRPN